MVQIVIEIITDTVCLVFEARRGLAPLAVWRELPKAALTPIILFALMVATLAGQYKKSLRRLSGQMQPPRRVLMRGRRPPAWRRARGLLLAAVPEQLGTTDELSKTTQARTSVVLFPGGTSAAHRVPQKRGSSKLTKVVVAFAAQARGKELAI
jgi:hypothetical protein